MLLGKGYEDFESRHAFHIYNKFLKETKGPNNKKSYFKKDINPGIIIVRSLVTFRDIRETIESGPLCIISE